MIAVARNRETSEAQLLIQEHGGDFRAVQEILHVIVGPASDHPP